jgi:hypothetical protein
MWKGKTRKTVPLSQEVIVVSYAPAPVTELQKADLEDLAKGWMDLPAKDHSFVQSLLLQWNTKQWLSGKQWYWLQKLAEKLPDRQVPDFSLGLDAELEEIERLRVEKSSLALS